MSDNIFVEGEAVGIALRERTLCMKAMCNWCREDTQVRWCTGGGGFWAHYDGEDGANLGCCRANAIRKLESL